MAEDYRTIAETETNPLAPIVAALMKALEMNPRAIAAGAPGAPRVEGRALDVHLGTLALAGTTPVGVADLDRHTWLRADYHVTGGTSATLQAAYSNDNGSNWGSWQNVGAIANTGTNSESDPVNGFGVGWLRLNLQTGAVRFAGALLFGSAGVNNAQMTSGSVTHTVPDDCNAVQFRLTAGSAVLSIDALGGLTA